MITTMALLVAFKAGSFDNFVSENFGDIEPDSTKKDTLLLKDYILLSDSAFVIPAYVYSSKAMVMDYKLEFDTVYRDTIYYGTAAADSILMTFQIKELRGGDLKKDMKYMGSSKSGIVIDPSMIKVQDTSDIKQPNKK